MFRACYGHQTEEEAYLVDARRASAPLRADLWSVGFLVSASDCAFLRWRSLWPVFPNRARPGAERHSRGEAATKRLRRVCVNGEAVPLRFLSKSNTIPVFWCLHDFDVRTVLLLLDQIKPIGRLVPVN